MCAVQINGPQHNSESKNTKGQQMIHFPINLNEAQLRNQLYLNFHQSIIESIIAFCGKSEEKEERSSFHNWKKSVKFAALVNPLTFPKP